MITSRSFVLLIFILTSFQMRFGYAKSCELPTMNVFEKSAITGNGSTNETIILPILRKPGSDGSVKIAASGARLFLICSSNQPINVQYIDQEIKGRSRGQSALRTDKEFFIELNFLFTNSTSFGQFYCNHVKNSCGYAEISVKSSNGLSTITNTLHPNKKKIPPLRRLLSSQIVPEIINPERVKSIIFFVKVDMKTKNMFVNCTVDIDNDKILGDISYIRPDFAITVEAVLRNKISHPGSLRILEEYENCLNCTQVRDFDFQPTVFQCFHTVYNSHQFLFFPVTSYYQTSLAMPKIYQTWTETDFQDMMYVIVPEIIYEGDDPIFQCIYSHFVFAYGYKFSIRGMSTSGWEHISLTDSPDGVDDIDQRLTILSIQFQSIGIDKVQEIRCLGKVWNSTKNITSSKKVVVLEEPVPSFAADYEEIEWFYGVLNKTLSCATTFNRRMDYQWSSLNEMENATHISDGSGSILQFSFVGQGMQNGLYSCTAKNSKGSATKVFRITVLYDDPVPSFATDYEEIEWFYGDLNKTLSCATTFNRRMLYEWSSLNGMENTTVIPDDSGSVLQVSFVGQGIHNGMYNCTAKNSKGYATKVFNITVLNVQHVPKESASAIPEFNDEADDNVTEYHLNPLIVSLVVCGSAVLVLTIILIFILRRHFVMKEILRGLTEKEVNDFYMGQPELLTTSVKINAQNLDLMPYDYKYETELRNITFESGKILGSGEFSLVCEGYWKSRDRNVAVKIAKPSADVQMFKCLLSEIKIMIFIGKQENIVSLLAVCTQNIQTRSVHIILEMCENGSLDVLLRKSRDTFLVINKNDCRNSLQVTDDSDSLQLSTIDLIRWAGEIANGMEALSSKGVIHADLASRNVLIDQHFRAKVSDFGLSKKLYDCNNYVKKSKCKVPWRWMALECLQTLTFSTESDVWSYGITLWEMFTLGDVPYPNSTWNDDFIETLMSGIRLRKPQYSPPEVYSRMMACWSEQCSSRPPFSELRAFFRELLAGYSDRDYYNLDLTGNSKIACKKYGEVEQMEMEEIVHEMINWLM